MSEKEQRELVALLRKQKEGFVPFEVFLELMRLVTSTAIELIVFRQFGDGDLRVLLPVRDEEFVHDYWTGKVHIPGVVLRPGDSDSGNLKVPFRRILEKELGGLKTSKPQRVTTQYRKSHRGSECGHIFMATTEEFPTVGEFYPVDDLPENIISIHIEPIQQAVKLFKQSTA